MLVHQQRNDTYIIYLTLRERKTHRQTDKQAGRQAGRQTDRQTYRQLVILKVALLLSF